MTTIVSVLSDMSTGQPINRTIIIANGLGKWHKKSPGGEDPTGA